MSTAAVHDTNSPGIRPALPTGSLFKGLKFFLLQRIPSRSRYVSAIEENGGLVIRFEEQADYTIADHLRPEAPRDSYSYTFIEASLRNGSLSDLAEHACAAHRSRLSAASSSSTPSSISRPMKSVRTPFTPQDDLILWHWVRNEVAAGASAKGNALYKRLEVANSRHTFQAWRDRYIKRLMDRPPLGTATTKSVGQPARSPANDGETRNIAHAQSLRSDEENEFRQPIPHATDIEGADPSFRTSTWNASARQAGEHRVDNWRAIPETQVRPPLERPRFESAQQDALDEDDCQNATSATSHGEIYCANTGKRKRDASDSGGLADQNQDRRKIIPKDARIVPKLDNYDLQAMLESSVDIPILRERPGTDVSAPIRHELNQLDMSVQASISMSEIKISANDGEVHEVQNTKEPDGCTEISHGGAVPTSETSEIVEERLQYEKIVLDVPEAESSADTRAERENLLFDQLLVADAGSDAATPEKYSDDQDMSDMGAQIDIPIPDAACVTRSGNRGVRHRAFESNDNLALVMDAGRSATSNGESTRFLNTWSPSRSRQSQWSIEEDQVILKGTRLQWSANYIVHNLPSPHLRTASAIRNRQVQLRTMSGDSDTLAIYAEQDASAGFKAKLVAGEADIHHEFDEALNPLKFAGQKVQHRSHKTDAIEPLNGKRDNESKTLGNVLSSPLDASQSVDLVDLSRSDQKESRNQVGDDLSLPKDAQHISGQQTSSFATGPKTLLLSNKELSDPSDAPKKGESEGENEEESEEANEGGGEVSEEYEEMEEEEYSGDEQNREDMSRWDMSSALGDLDLTIAEPVGGFDLPLLFSSSSTSAQRSSSTDVAPTGHKFLDHHQEAKTRDTIDLSSNSSSSVHEESDHYETQAPIQPSGNGYIMDTQDIVNAETQSPDFDIPFLAESYQTSKSDEHGHSSTIHQKIFTGNVSAEDEDLDSWIATMTVRGFKTNSIIQALKCTSQRAELAILVLFEEKAGHKLPDDVPGIWSKAEDEALDGSDARALRLLAEKHGDPECEARRVYLEGWRKLD